MIPTVLQPQTDYAPELMMETAVSPTTHFASAGQRIAETNIDEERIYLVMSGRLRTELDQIQLEVLEAGEFVDMLDLWDVHGSGTAVIADTACELVEVSDELAQQLERHPLQFTVQIMRRMQLLSQSHR